MKTVVLVGRNDWWFQEPVSSEDKAPRAVKQLLDLHPSLKTGGCEAKLVTLGPDNQPVGDPKPLDLVQLGLLK